MGTFLNIICLPDDNCSGTSQDYEKLNIRWLGNKGHYRYVFVRYKGRNCSSAVPL